MIHPAEYVEGLLPQESQHLFADIVHSRVLGATTHIDMIGKMLVSVACDPSIDADDMVSRLTDVADYFRSTRGQQSRAIHNAINIMTPTLEQLKGLDRDSVKELLRARVSVYSTYARESVARIVEYGKQLTANLDSLLVFDYSSVVNAFLEGIESETKVYIPESRALDGGRPFVPACVRAKHRTHFVPDTAMLHVLKRCQAAFIGAETFFPDGTVFNTIGSDILAVLCRHVDIPLYVLTPMIKADIRPVYGYVRTSPMPYDFSRRLAAHWPEEDRAAVDFTGIKLLTVQPEFIKAYITEQGIIPTPALYALALAFGRRVEGGEIDV